MQKTTMMLEEPLTPSEVGKRKTAVARLMCEADELMTKSDDLKDRKKSLDDAAKAKVQEARKAGREAHRGKAPKQVKCNRVLVADRGLYAILRDDNEHLVQWGNMSDIEKQKAKQGNLPALDPDEEKLVESAIKQLDGLTKAEARKLKAAA